MKTKLLLSKAVNCGDVRTSFNIFNFVFIFLISLATFGQDPAIVFDCLDSDGNSLGTISFGPSTGNDQSGYSVYPPGEDNGGNVGYILEFTSNSSGEFWEVFTPGGANTLFLSDIDTFEPPCSSDDWTIASGTICSGLDVECFGTTECTINIDISIPVSPIEIGAAVNLFADFGGFTPVNAVWSFSSDGIIFEYSKPGDVVGSTIEFNNTAPEIPAGVYTVKLVVTDECGDETEVIGDSFLVIYDPNGGFVTGGGWINSPEGALVGTTTIGSSNFGFVAKYKNGNTIVNGNTNFQFSEGDFHFKSSEYEDMSLVISGQRKATFRGSGTVNGDGTHKFMVTVIDGDATGGDGLDKFRIKVWADGSSSQVMYDNEIGVAENADSNTILGGGSIVIHKAKSNDISLVSSEVGLVTWPNPFKEYVNMTWRSDNEKNNIEIRVFDINGRQVYFMNGISNQQYVIGNSLETGLYIINVRQANESKQVKLIKY